MNKKRKLFLDMDGVIADIHNSSLFEVNDDFSKSLHLLHKKLFFKSLRPIVGAKDAVQAIWDSQFFDIYILTQPVKDGPYSYSEKCEWVMEHFPYLTDRMNMSQHKELLSNSDSILIDDRPEIWEERWESAGGEFIPFKGDWRKVLYELEQRYEISFRFQ